MKIIAVSKENDTIRERFFRFVFADEQGYIGVAWKDRKDKFEEAFFVWPEQSPQLLEWINRHLSDNLYFCPQLLSRPRRTKDSVAICPNVWADIDDLDKPSALDPAPSVLIESSPGRYQGLWLLKQSAEPEDAERASRRLAYKIGADPSGWDLTQLLRVPLSYNLKYDVGGENPIVKIEAADPTKRYTLSRFLDMAEPPEAARTDVPFPEDKIAALNADDILKKHRNRLLPHVYTLFEQAPDSDWSEALWSLECMLLEAGLSLEEAFAVAWDSAVNKYKRDGRPKRDLWREVCKAKNSVELRTGESEPAIEFDPLLDSKELEYVNSLEPTFIERYIEWGKGRSDAAPQYHEAGAFILLSCIIAEGVRLPTSFGTIIPNLWFMILGDTTLTRKSTAMDMAIDNIMTVYDECILATDGSIEGILTALSVRPSQASLFWRDEFSGLLESMQKRDYYGGMAEAFTKLYDGKLIKRQLRKEVYEIREPVFIFFAGGIKSKILELMTSEYIISGFAPRFVYVIADADVNSFRPAGPASDTIKTLSASILDEVVKIREIYSTDIVTMVGDQSVETRKIWNASLTPDAWERYNKFERDMVLAGVSSDAPELYTPTLDRLAKSGLKAAMLIATSRQDARKHGEVIVEKDDILRAIKYVEGWRTHSLYIVENAGKTMAEKTLERALRLVKGGKNTRSALMRSMKLSARDATLILDTLEQRGLIIRSRFGKGEKIFPVGT